MPAGAQPGAPSGDPSGDRPFATPAEAAAARAAAERGHLVRVGAWGVAGAAGGAALALAARSDGARAFGLQTALWGGINVAIAGAGLAGGAREAPASWAEALRAEDRLGAVLLVNLGLNVGYVLVGSALVAVAPRGVAQPARWRGHGAAVVVQGLALLVLDGAAYAGSSARERAVVGRLAVAPSAEGVSLRVSW